MLLERMIVNSIKDSQVISGKKLLRDHRWRIKMALLIEYYLPIQVWASGIQILTRRATQKLR